MSRTAIVASLMLHAALLFAAGRWLSLNSARSDFGKGAVGASFLAKEWNVSLLAEAAVPRPPEPPIEPQFAAPEFREPAPVAVLPTSSPSAVEAASAPEPQPAILAIAAPLEMPGTKPRVSSSKGGRSVRGASERTGGSADGSRGANVARFVPPQFRFRDMPVYPEEARAKRLEGMVLLLVTVDAAGRVADANIHRSSGHAVLDRAALSAVRSWRFDPARRGGVAVTAQVEVPVRFRFEDRSGARI